LQLGDDDLALAGAPLARARTFWRLSARFVELSIHRHTGVIKLAATVGAVETRARVVTSLSKRRSPSRRSASRSRGPTEIRRNRSRPGLVKGVPFCRCEIASACSLIYFLAITCEIEFEQTRTNRSLSGVSARAAITAVLG